MTSAKKLVCGHLFHVHCLRSWLERQNTCPTCRALVVPAENATSTASGNRGPHQESLQQGIGLAIQTYFCWYWTLCSQLYLSLDVLSMDDDLCASDCPEDECVWFFVNMVTNDDALRFIQEPVLQVLMVRVLLFLLLPVRIWAGTRLGFKPLLLQPLYMGDPLFIHLLQTH